jgi:hypothetical protein
MKRWALIEDGKVTNVVEQATQPVLFGSWVETPTHYVSPGWSYIDGEFVDPRPPITIPNIITKVSFRFRMTDTEYVGVLTAAKTDVEVQAWVETFNMVSQVNLSDERTVAGLNVLVSKGLLTQERATEILSTTVLEGERP